MKRLWLILQKRSSGTNYENSRLLEASQELGLKAEIILHPTVDIIVAKEGRRSIRVKNKIVDILIVKKTLVFVLLLMNQ